MSRQLLHTPQGVRDIYSEECARKMAVQSELLRVFHLYGYQNIETPTFEFYDIFKKERGSAGTREVGTVPSKELYKFFDRENNTLVLRPDMTPPIARCVAKYFMDETGPLRLCYLGPTYLNGVSYQGRLNETTQTGVELIGDDSVQADAEMIAMTIEALYHAGLSDFQISIGNLEYFKGICAEAGLDEETELELRDFISGKNYFGAEELLDRIGVNKKDKELLLKVSDLFGTVSILEDAKKAVSNKRSKHAIERLEKLYRTLVDYGVEKYVSFDLGMLSKYNYYTGIIFKGYTYGVGDAIVKGGRYDSLLGRFGKEAAAIGFVIVVDDLLAAMGRQNVIISGIEEPVKLYYTEETFKEKLMEAKHMRSSGKKVELLPKSGK